MSRHFTLPTAQTLRDSLAQCLIPVVDAVRDISTQLGFRAYIIRVIRTRWSGLVRGQGLELIDHTLTILPVPKMSDLSSLAEIVTQIGLDETGSVVLTEVSGAYGEDVLLGRDGSGNPPEPEAQVFYEIEFIRPDGQPGERRRFFPSGAPSYDPAKFQWTVRLERAREGRDRMGDLQ